MSEEEIVTTPAVIEQPIEDHTLEQSTEEVAEEVVAVETPVEETIPEVVEAPVVVETPAEVVAPVATVVEETPVSKLTVAEQQLLDSLNTYGMKMAPRKPISVEDGARSQYLLWNTINSVLNSDPAEFKGKWRILLSFANSSPTFGSLYINRFSEYWVWDLTALSCFQRIINLIKLTCNPSELAVGLKIVSIEKTMQEHFTPLASQNIFTYYGK